jgi:hypothetical protein
MILKKSFKGLGWNQVHTFGYDILQYVITMLVVLFFIWQLNALARPIEQVRTTADDVNRYLAGAGTLPPLTEELSAAMKVQEGSIRNLACGLTLLTVLCAAVLVSTSGLLRGFVYKRLTGQRRGYLWTFFRINTMWLFIWTLLVVAIFAALELRYAAVLFVFGSILFWHLSSVLRCVIRPRQRFIDVVKLTIRIGIVRGYRFLAPLGIILVMLFLLTAISYFGRILSQNIVIFIAFITGFAFISWARTYYSMVVEAVQ